MKKSGFLAASIAAASATAISASCPSSFACNSKIQLSQEKVGGNRMKNRNSNPEGRRCGVNTFVLSSSTFLEAGSSKHMDDSSSRRSHSTDKFAPKFDGLRFIETLVTAHR